MNVLSIQRVFQLLLVFYLILLALHVFVVVEHFHLNPDDQFFRRLNHFFDFDEEVNFPTYFSSMLLFLCAQTFFFIAIKSGEQSWYVKSNWFLFSCVFLFLSVDDFVQIHEWMSVYTQNAGIGGTGLLRFAWLVPFAVALVLLGAYSFKFILSMDKFFRTQYILCAILFLIGTLVMESFGGKYYESINNEPNLLYRLFFVGIEESLKTLGLIVLIKTNLIHLNTLKMRAELN